MVLIRKARTFIRLASQAGVLTVLKSRFLARNTKYPARIGSYQVTLRARTGDLSIALDNLLAEYESLGDLLPKDFSGVIIDAGGHIGLAAVRLATLYRNAEIVTIEPSAENFDLLIQNTRGFRNVSARRLALTAGDETEVTLQDRGRDQSGFTIVQSAADTENLTRLDTVPTISISGLLKEFGDRIGFMKIDIEGAEADILESAAFREANISAVYIELHERIRPGCTAAFRAYTANRWVLNLGGEKYLSLARD